MKNEGGRSLAPRSSKAIDEPTDTTLRDPIAVAMEIAAGDDPSVAELAAFRRQPLDLKNAARNAKNLHSEEFRVWLARESGDDVGEAVCGGLEIMSISLIALVALWPADDLDMAEAKLALDQRTGVQLHNREKDFDSSMEAQTARRIRWRRGAFAVPALMLPPAPTAPQSDDRGLVTWPLERFDLVQHLPKRGGVPAFADRQVVEWTRFARSAPNMDGLLQRATRMFETCDRLLELAGRGPANASELMAASEGARLMGYRSEPLKLDRFGLDFSVSFPLGWEQQKAMKASKFSGDPEDVHPKAGRGRDSGGGDLLAGKTAEDGFPGPQHDA